MDKIDQEIGRLNEAIRKAHETMKDLKAARTELNEFIRQIRVMLDEEVTKQVDALGSSAQKAIEDSEERIMKRFENLEKKIFTATNDPAQTTLETIFDKMIERKHLNVLMDLANKAAVKRGFVEALGLEQDG